MSETREGPVEVGWNYGDPPIGFYVLKLVCERCGAPSGHIWPDADARARGTRFAYYPGNNGAGICRRCRRTNTMLVDNDPPVRPPQVEDWSY